MDYDDSKFQRFILGILLFLLLLVLGDAWWKGEFLGEFPSDLTAYVLPGLSMAFSELRRGHLMLWNPHLFGGCPFFGDFLGLMYPPNYINLFLPLRLAVNIEIFFHLYLAGIFVYLWSIKRGLDSSAALSGAVIFMMGGPFFLNLTAGHFATICTVAWIPFLFYAVDHLLERISWKWSVFGVMGLSMQILAGEIQYVFFTLIVIFLYIGLSFYFKGFQWRVGAVGLGVLTAAAGLTAVQWLTTWAGIKEGVRGLPLSLDNATTFSLPPESLLTLFMPDFFGGEGTLPYWGRWFFWEFCIFLGITAFWMMVWAFFSSRNEALRPLRIIFLLMFLLAMGSYTPLFKFLYYWVPGFDHFRGYLRFNVFFQLFSAMLAAYGLDHFRKNESISKKSLLAPGLAALFLGLLSYTLYHPWILGGDGLLEIFFHKCNLGRELLAKVFEWKRADFIKEASSVAAFSASLASGLCLAFWLVSTVIKDRKKASVLLVLLLTVELTAFARVNRPTFKAGEYDIKIRALRGFFKDHPGDFRVVGDFVENNVEPWGLDIWGYSPMTPRRSMEFISRTQGVSLDDYITRVRVFHQYPPALSILRLRYALMDEGDHLGIYPIPLPEMPRIQFLDRWRVVPDAAASLEAVTAPGFNPEKETVLEEAPPFSISLNRKPIQVSLAVKDVSSDCLEIEAKVDRPGVLVLGDNFQKGWKVVSAADSFLRKYRIVPADYLLRGIPLESGNHHFYMVYRPMEFIIGKWISLFTAVLLVGVLIFRVGIRSRWNKAPLYHFIERS